MNKIIAAAVVSFATLATSAHAATPTKADPVKQCFDHAQDQEQQARCYDAAVAVQKKRLNAAYNKLIAHRKAANDSAGIAALNQMQKDWIKSPVWLFARRPVPVRRAPRTCVNHGHQSPDLLRFFDEASTNSNASLINFSNASCCAGDSFSSRS